MLHKKRFIIYDPPPLAELYRQLPGATMEPLINPQLATLASLVPRQLQPKVKAAEQIVSLDAGGGFYIRDYFD